MAKETVPLQV